MGFFSERYSRPGPGIEKNAPTKKGIPLFFEILGREFFELLKLNLLFLLFCIPVVTIPAALTAMSRITVTMVRDETHFLGADFLRAFKSEFGRSTLAGLLLALGIMTAVYSLQFYWLAVNQRGGFFYLPLGISAAILLVLIGMSLYIFPLIALVDLPFRLMIKNSFLLTFICLPHNIAVFAVNGLILFLFVGLMPYSLPAALVGIFALLNFISTFCAYAGIRKYVITGQA